jgi:hypothetical protein
MAIQRRTFQAPATAPEMTPDAPTEPVDASIESGSGDVTPVDESALGKARSALAQTDGELATLLAARDEALAADDDVRAMELDGEIAAKERLRKVQVDKVGLRQAEAERTAAEQRAAAKAEIIAGIEALLAERDAAGAELAAAIEAADKNFVKLIELGREIRQRWKFSPHDANPCLLTENTLALAIPHEFFRLTARVHPLGGKIVTDMVPSFPAGSKAERIEFAMEPSKITPLAKKLEAASALASRVMRSGFSTSQLSVIPSSTASPDEARPSNIEALPTTSPFKAEPNPELARLLSRQNQLVSRQMSVEDEAEYAANGEAIKALSA